MWTKTPSSLLWFFVFLFCYQTLFFFFLHKVDRLLLYITKDTVQPELTKQPHTTSWHLSYETKRLKHRHNNIAQSSTQTQQTAKPFFSEKETNNFNKSWLKIRYKRYNIRWIGVQPNWDWGTIFSSLGQSISNCIPLPIDMRERGTYKGVYNT